MNRQTEVLTHTFTQEHNANDIISLGTLPANAKILSVEIVSQDLNASVDLAVGHNGTSTIAPVSDEFSRSLTYAISGPDLYVLLDGRCQQYSEAITIQCTIKSNTSSVTGATLNLIIDYVL
jgi:hypothetical protein